MSKKILVWFRNDLRLHDNEMLVEAIAKADKILPVFIFDPRHFQKNENGIYKTGINRSIFLLDSVQSLRDSLKGQLLITHGLPKDILPVLVEKYQITEVYHHREVAPNETMVSSNVEDALWKLKINLKHFVGHTLFNKEDLPFPIKDIPEDFLKFKKKVEREAIVKPCFDTPKKINFIKLDDWGEIPTLQQLNEDFVHNIEKSSFKGGEKEALNQLKAYLKTPQQNPKTAKHEIISRLSAWIAMGCLSPRKIYWKIKNELEITPHNPGLQQLLIGMFWRDYYRFMLKKHQQLFFDDKEANTTDPSNLIKFQHWKNAQSTSPLNNLIINKLNNTGYINFTERQYVARYAIEKLGIDWRLGKDYFEEQLIDFCPASNLGNWANLAGKGYLKSNSQTDLSKLGKLLDPKGVFTEL